MVRSFITWQDVNCLHTPSQEVLELEKIRRLFEKYLLELVHRGQGLAPGVIWGMPCDHTTIIRFILENSEIYQKVDSGSREGWYSQESVLYRLHESIALRTEYILSLLLYKAMFEQILWCGLPWQRIVQFVEKIGENSNENSRPIVFHVLLELITSLRDESLESWQLEAVSSLLGLNAQELPPDITLRLIELSLVIALHDSTDENIPVQKLPADDSLPQALTDSDRWFSSVAAYLLHSVSRKGNLLDPLIFAGVQEFASKLSGKSPAHDRRAELLKCAINDTLTDEQRALLPEFEKEMKERKLRLQEPGEDPHLALCTLVRNHRKGWKGALDELTKNRDLIFMPLVQSSIHDSLALGPCDSVIAERLINLAQQVRQEDMKAALADRRPHLFKAVLGLGLEAFGRLPFEAQENLRARIYPLSPTDCFGQMSYELDIVFDVKVMGVFNKLLEGDYQDTCFLRDVSSLVLQCPQHVLEKAVHDGIRNRHQALLMCRVLRRFKGLCNCKDIDGSVIILSQLRELTKRKLNDFQIENLRVFVKGLYTDDLNAIVKAKHRCEQDSLVEVWRTDFERVKVSPARLARKVLIPICGDITNLRPALLSFVELFSSPDGLSDWAREDIIPILQTFVQLCCTEDSEKIIPGDLIDLASSTTSLFVQLILNTPHLLSDKDLETLQVLAGHGLWARVHLAPLIDSLRRRDVTELESIVEEVLGNSGNSGEFTPKILKLASLAEDSCDLVSSAIRSKYSSDLAFEKAFLMGLLNVTHKVTPYGLERLLTRFTGCTKSSTNLLNLVGRFAYKYLTPKATHAMSVTHAAINAMKFCLGEETIAKEICFDTFRHTCLLLSRADRVGQPTDALFIFACYLLKKLKMIVDQELSSLLQGESEEWVAVQASEEDPYLNMDGIEEALAEEALAEEIEEYLEMAKLEVFQLPNRFQRLLSQIFVKCRGHQKSPFNDPTSPHFNEHGK